MPPYSLHRLLATLPPQGSALPDLPPGPSLDRVRGPIEIPLYAPWQIALIAVVAAIALGLIGWGILRYLRTRRQHTQQLPPYQTALAELQTAATFTADDDERFAMLSSLALRRYFASSLGIAAEEQTTSEFLQQLERHPQLNAETQASLAQFLEHCDRVKFARVSLSTAERETLSTSATDLIQYAEQANIATEARHA